MQQNPPWGQSQRPKDFAKPSPVQSPRIEPVKAKSEKIGIFNRIKREKVALYIFLATIFLSPLVFVTSPYLALDLAKTIVIAIGALASTICYILLFLKEREINIPPKPLFCTAILLAISLFISSFLSIHSGRSIFGQGFEIGTTSMILLCLLGGWIAYEAVRRDIKHAKLIYGSLIVAFIVLVLFHALRLIFGPTFLSLSIFTSGSSTILGKWYDLAIYAVMIVIVSSSALMLLPLSRTAKILNSILGVVALLAAIGINHQMSWVAAVIAFGVMTVALFTQKSAEGKSGIKAFMARIPWLPTILFLLAILFVWQGSNISKPIIQKTGTQPSEIPLPWQMTLDVVGGSIKGFPLFGVGPNHFSQAFMVFKPAGLNQTDAWAMEFSTGFGLLPTMVATQGVVGTVLWLLLLVFLGIAIARSIKRFPQDPYLRFVTVSSSASSIFLWLVAILYVPSQVMFFTAFLMTGIFVASAVANGVLMPRKIAPISPIMRNVIVPALLIIFVVVAVLWALIYVKKTIALGYFSSGVRSLTVKQDFKAADLAFNKALSFDKSDVYWEALSENYRLNISQLISSATSSSPALITRVTDMVNSGVSAARSAIAFDPSNYYNYLSEARISQLAASIKTPNAYENAVQAYTNAINLDPTNPSLYVNLAQLQADNSKLDDALKTLGVAIQVKSNYLDAIFLLSQVQAAKGDLPNAIIAAQVATQINPNSPVLYFQLGLLQYNAKNYQPAVDALTKAVTLQPDYANARYFLGLSQVRVNDIAGAITQFEQLSKGNPDNAEISFILNNLRAGKSPFKDAQPPVTATPEKRPSLPVKEK